MSSQITKKMRVEYQKKKLTMTLILNRLHFVNFTRVRQGVFSYVLDIFVEKCLKKISQTFSQATSSLATI